MSLLSQEQTKESQYYKECSSPLECAMSKRHICPEKYDGGRTTIGIIERNLLIKQDYIKKQQQKTK